MDFFFQNEQQKPPAQAAGTAATPPRPVLRPLKKPGTSVTSADEAESGGAKGAESTAGSKKGIVSRHSLKFETLHKEKAQEAAEAKSPSQKKADQEAAEARKKEAEALEAAAAKKKADDDKAAAEKKKANEKFAAQRAADDKAATRKKVLAEKAAAEKAAAETAAAEKRRAAAEALAEEKRVAAEKAAAEQLKATEKAYSFANLLIVLDEVANIPCKKKLQNVPDVHSVAELLEAIVERLKDDFERLGLPTDVNAKQSSSKHPAYSLQYFDRDFDEFVELDDSGEPLQARFVYVDEYSCVGCTLCTGVATNTFMMEEEYGRARVFNQEGDDLEIVAEAIGTCPVDCIHFVSWEDLIAQEVARDSPNRGAMNFKARLVGGETQETMRAYDKGAGGGSGGWEMPALPGNSGARCNNCPGNGCKVCPMFGVGENPIYVKRKLKIDQKRKARKAQKAAAENGATSADL